MFRGGEEERERIIGKCVMAFPYLWIFVRTAACLFCLLPADLSCLVSAC